MSTLSETIDGVTRVADAAEEKFNELLEISGKTEEDVLNFQKEKEEGKSEEETDMSTEDGASGGGDENTIPTPENIEGAGAEMVQNGADMAAAQSGVEGGAQPPMEIPPEAQQMMPPDAGAEAAAQGVALTPEEEEELLKQQQSAAQQ